MLDTYLNDIQLSNRAVINLRFRLATPLHIGQRAEGIVKKITLFDVDGETRPIIPAESFKGTMRHLATKLAKPLSYDDQLVEEVVRCHAKDIHKGLDVQKELIDSMGAWITSNNLIDRKQYEGLSDKNKIEIYASSKCPICRLFGSRVSASKLIFEDVILQGTPEVITYTSTSIDRRRGLVEEERLFSVELIPPDPEYSLRTRIIVNNVERGSAEAMLLSTVLRYIIDGGLLVGGGKSRGYGLLKIADESNVILLNLDPMPKDDEDVMRNAYALLLIDGYVEKLTIDEYISYLVK